MLGTCCKAGKTLNIGPFYNNQTGKSNTQQKTKKELQEEQLHR